MQEKIKKDMEKLGLFYDNINSYKGYYIFNNSMSCMPMTFEKIKDIKEYIKNVVVD